MSDDATNARLKEQIHILGHALGLVVTDPLDVIPQRVIDTARSRGRREAVREFKRLGMGFIAATRAVDAALGTDMHPTTPRWYDNQWIGPVGGVAVFVALAAILRWVL